MDAGTEVSFEYNGESEQTTVTIGGVVLSITDGVAVVEERAAYSVWGHSNRCVGRRHVIEASALEEKPLADYARKARPRDKQGIELHGDSELIDTVGANIRDELMAPEHPGR